MSADPNCSICHGTGVIEGAVHQVIPSDPGAAWWKDSDRVCPCAKRTVIIHLSCPECGGKGYLPTVGATVSGQTDPMVRCERCDTTGMMPLEREHLIVMAVYKALRELDQDYADRKHGGVAQGVCIDKIREALR